MKASEKIPFLMSTKNLGGRSQIYDQMLSHKSGIMSARSQIDTSKPFRLSNFPVPLYPVSPKKFELSRGKDYQNASSASITISPSRSLSIKRFKSIESKSTKVTTIDSQETEENLYSIDVDSNNQSKGSQRIGKLQQIIKSVHISPLKGGRKDYMQQLNHTLSLNASHQRILELGSISQRKKNKFDPAIYPPIIKRSMPAATIIDYYNISSLQKLSSPEKRDSYSQDDSQNIQPSMIKRRKSNRKKQAQLQQEQVLNSLNRLKAQPLSSQQQSSNNLQEHTNRLNLSEDDLQKLKKKHQQNQHLHQQQQQYQNPKQIKQHLYSQQNNLHLEKIQSTESKRNKKIPEDTQNRSIQSLNQNNETKMNKQSDCILEESEEEGTLRREKKIPARNHVNSSNSVERQSKIPLHQHSLQQLLSKHQRKSSVQESNSSASSFRGQLSSSQRDFTNSIEVNDQDNHLSRMYVNTPTLFAIDQQSHFEPSFPKIKYSELQKSTENKNSTPKLKPTKHQVNSSNNVHHLSDYDQKIKPTTITAFSQNDIQLASFDSPKIQIPRQSRPIGKISSSAKNTNPLSYSSPKHLQQQSTLLQTNSSKRTSDFSAENPPAQNERYSNQKLHQLYSVGFSTTRVKSKIDYSLDIPVVGQNGYSELRIRLKNLVMKYAISDENNLKELFNQSLQKNSHLDINQLNPIFEEIRNEYL